MKKITLLILMVLFLSACSSARPVIRTEESAQGVAITEDTTIPDEAEDPVEEAQPNDVESKGLTMATDARKTAPEKTKPEQMISASEKDVAVNNLADPSTQAVTKPAETTPAATVPTQVTGMSTQPPASITSGVPIENEFSAAELLEGPDAEGEHEISEFNLFDYYPLVPNREVYFASEEYGPSTLILQYLYEERGKATAQIKQTGQDGEHLNVIRIAEGQVNDLYYTVETPYRSNIIGWTEYEMRTILKEPLEVGNRWQSTGLDFEITAVDETRLIQDETMTVMDVMVSSGGEKVRFTYALGIGLVSNDVVNADGSLTNIVQFEGLTEEAMDYHDIDFYFPTDDGDYLVHTAAAAFRTNDAPKDIITQLYKDIAGNQGYTPVLGDNALIQYIFLEDDIARVDLNDGFIHFINQAPELESARIQSLINTVSKYYEARGVILTVNDQRYESAQLMFEKTEILTPDHRSEISSETD